MSRSVAGSTPAAMIATSGQTETWPKCGANRIPRHDAGGDEDERCDAQARPRARAQYGGVWLHHSPSTLKAFQNAVFAGCSSSDSSMSGVTSPWIVGVSSWSSPSTERELAREREAGRVEERDRALAHRDHELGLDDVQLAQEEGPRLLLVTARELEAVRPVDRHRVDVQALQRLEERVAGAAVERDSLLQLRRLRRVLEEEDVGERMAGAENRDAGSPGSLRELVTESVALGDRLLQVLLVDLVRSPRSADRLERRRHDCRTVLRRDQVGACLATRLPTGRSAPTRSYYWVCTRAS